MYSRRKSSKRSTTWSSGPVPINSDTNSIPSISASHRPISPPELSPSMLQAISATRPSNLLMRQYVRDAYKNQDLSPTFIDGVMASLSTDEVAYNKPDHELQNKIHKQPDDLLDNHDDSDLGICLVIDHVPGVNDYMVGARSSTSRRPSESYNESVDCWDERDAQFIHMKWRILRSRELVHMPNLFDDPVSCESALPDDVLITNDGLRRAIQDLYSFDWNSSTHDQALLHAISRRAGRCDDTLSSVLYPEDMVPYFNVDDLSFYDVDYWFALKGQGWKFWYEDHHDR